MRSLGRSTLFLFFILLGGQSILIPTVADARCCMCGTCTGGCTCPGSYPCGWCFMPVPKDLQVTAAFSDRTSDDTFVVEESLSSTAINSRGIDRLIRSAGTGQCGRNNYRLQLTDGEKPLKLDQVFLKDYVEDPAELQLVSNREK
jgi:hypothetical protein